jgi:hypothetical protein
MNRTPRKNLRGFMSHVQCLVDRQIREEFPDLGPVWVCPGVLPGLKQKALAHWFEHKYTGTVSRMIMLNTDDAEGRRFYLEAADNELRDIIRHELLHGEMQRRGQPSKDDDVPFILECLRRRLPVNPDSIGRLEDVHGHGSFDFFQTFLPPAEVESIFLAGGGVWLREKR